MLSLATAIDNDKLSAWSRLPCLPCQPLGYDHRENHQHCYTLLTTSRLTRLPTIWGVSCPAGTLPNVIPLSLPLAVSSSLLLSTGHVGVIKRHDDPFFSWAIMTDDTTGFFCWIWPSKHNTCTFSLMLAISTAERKYRSAMSSMPINNK